MFNEQDQRTLTFFVHIPKTGGTSLKHMLHPLFPREAIYPSVEDSKSLPKRPFRWLLPYLNIDCIRRLTSDRKREIQFLRGHLPYCVGELFDRPIRYLTFFRHPVDRAISELKHTRSVDPNYRSMSIDQIAADKDFFDRRIRNLQTRYFAHQLTNHLTGATTPLDLTADDISRARRRIAQLDFIGLLEDYDVSIAMLRSQFKLPIEKIERRRANYQECATPPGLPEYIARESQHDMELYEYLKELFEQRRKEFCREAA